MKTASSIGFRLLSGLSVVSAVLFVVACSTGVTSWIGPALAACFLSLSLAASMADKAR